jgi:hypothetical protein
MGRGEVSMSWRDNEFLYSIWWWWLGVRGTTRFYLRKLGILPPLTEEEKRAMMPKLADEIFKESPLIGRVVKKKRKR